MTLTISIPDELEAKIRSHANATGEPVSQYVGRLVAQAVARMEGDAALADFRAQVASSHISDDELDRLHETLRDEAWRDRQQTHKP